MSEETKKYLDYGGLEEVVAELEDRYVRFDTNAQSLDTTEKGNARTNINAQAVIDANNKLSADLVSDGSTNKAYTATEKTKLSGIESGAQVNVLEAVKSGSTTFSITNKAVDIQAVDNLTNYYTTSNTYTKTEVNALIEAIPSIQVTIVQTLPTADSTTYFNESKTVYMVRNSASSGSDYYEEYITIRTGMSSSYTYSWEKIGDTQIDLTNYLQKTSSTSQVYATDGSGNQTTLTYGTSATASNIVQRNNSGQIIVPETPTMNTFATSKKYVDTGLSGKQDTLNGVTDTSTDITIEKEYGDTTGLFSVGSSSISAQGNDGDGGGSFDITGELLGPGASSISLYTEGVVDNENVSAGLTLEPTGLSYTDTNTDGEGFLINSEPVATRTWTSTQLSGKQDALVSGTNIKTINSTSLLGSGNIDIHDITQVTSAVNMWELSDGVYYGRADYFYYKTNTPIRDFDISYLVIIGHSIALKIFNAIASNEIIWGSPNASTGSITRLNLANVLSTNNVINNLTSTSTTAPLSAAQGKALKDEIDDLPNTPITTAEITALFHPTSNS